MNKNVNEEKVVIKRFFGNKTQEYSAVVENGFVDISNNESISTDNIYFMDQIHSDMVVNLDDMQKNDTYIAPKCDALITTMAYTFLAVKTADCYPILVYDEINHVISAIHSGCESTRLKIIENVIKIMYNRYNSKPENIKIEIGAGISAKNYQVSEDIVCSFQNTFDDKSLGEYLDLRKIIIDTVIKNDILEKNITSCTDCTFEDNNYYSFRRDKTQKRQLSIIGMVYE